MSNSDSMNAWTQIQAGVREAERLMGQKQYNQSMIMSRDTLDFMIQCLTQNQSLETSNLSDIIDELYRQGIISKNTCDNYQKIRIIGDKAIRDNDNNAYNAHIAHTLLSQEVFAFSNDQAPRRRTGRTISRGASKAPAKNTASSKNTARNHQNAAKHTTPKKAEGIGIPTETIIKIAAPVLLLIVLILVVRACSKSAEDQKTSSASVSIATPSSAAIIPTTAPVPTTTAVPATAASSSAASTLKYKTSSSLRVRATPSTTGEVITVLPAGTSVDYVRAHDSEWAVINYNNRQVYVASQYLTTE